MTVATVEQLSRLRQRPHYTRLHLAVYEPGTVLAAQINMPAIGRGERVIDISVIAGDVFSVKRGMTCYIGTSASGRDQGRIRAISCDSNQLTLAENDITWVDGQYLTVVQYIEPWAIFPRIVLDDNNVPFFYKDYDIAYTDQNEYMDPVVNMGPNHAAFLDGTLTGSFASIWYTSSGTYDPTDNSMPTGFAWNFEGGMPTATFGPDPGYIDYTGAGHFMTSLTVTSQYGKEFTARRFVSIYTRPDEGPNMPITQWGLSSFDGSRDQGGYSLRLWVRQNVDTQKVTEGALIIIFTDDAEGSFQGKAGGNAENRSSILFNGYVEEGSLSINPVTNRVEFRASSITSRMKNLSGFSATLENVQNASTWNEMTNMTVDKAMAHFLRWHANILQIADFAPTGDEKPVEYMDFERTSVYDAVRNLYNSSLAADVVADRQGKIWSEINANLIPTGSRSLNTAIDLTNQDWRSAIDIEFRQDDNLAYLEMGGIAYGGAYTGSTDAFLAGAPGDAPSYFGSLERLSGLVIESQTQLNELVGLAWAHANARFPQVSVPLAGDYRIIDIAPQERIKLTLAAEDNYRGFMWDAKSFIPVEVLYDVKAAEQTALMSAILREETSGPPGETVEIPVDPPFPKFILPEIDLPPMLLPPPIDPIPIDPAPGVGGLAYTISDSSKFTRTRNLFAETPTWEDLTPPQSGANSVTGSYISFKCDPIDPENRGWLLTHTDGGEYSYWLYRIDNMNSVSPLFTQVLSAYDAADALGSYNGQCSIYDFDVSPMNRNVVYAIGSTQSLGLPSAYILRSTDAGLTWSGIQHFNYARIQDSTNRVVASEHSVVSGYAVPGSVNANEDAFLWTADLFANATELHHVGEYWDWHIPYQGNPGDLAVYFSIYYNSLSETKLQYSEDRGATLLDITPEYLTSNWAVGKAKAGGGGDDWAGTIKKNILTHPTNRLYVAALLCDVDNDPNDTIYFTSNSGPTGLSPAFDFRVVGGSSRSIANLNWHRTNPLLLTACGDPLTTSDFPPRIAVTDDGGITWIDKFDSWYDQIMGGVGTKPNFRVVEQVWTV